MGRDTENHSCNCGQSGGQALLGFHGGANAVPRHELKQAQRQFRLGFQSVRHAQVDALARYREIGVREARAPVFELREQRTGLGFARFQFAQRGAVDVARMAEVIAHPGRGSAGVPLFGGLFLGVEGERVIIPPGAAMQEGAQARQERKRGLDRAELPHREAATASGPVDNRASRPESP